MDSEGLPPHHERQSAKRPADAMNDVSRPSSSHQSSVTNERSQASDEENISKAVSFSSQEGDDRKPSPVPPKKKPRTGEKRTRMREKGKRGFFPQRLMGVINAGDMKHAIWWLDDGKYFAVKPDLFMKDVIPKYFPSMCSKFASFKRRLNRWGFRRLMVGEPPGARIYTHGLFQRDMPGSCLLMSDKRTANPQDTLSLAMHLNSFHQRKRTAASAATPTTRAASLAPESVAVPQNQARVPKETPQELTKARNSVEIGSAGAPIVIDNNVEEVPSQQGCHSQHEVSRNAQGTNMQDGVETICCKDAEEGLGVSHQMKAAIPVPRDPLVDKPAKVKHTGTPLHSSDLHGARLEQDYLLQHVERSPMRKMNMRQRVEAPRQCERDEEQHMSHRQQAALSRSGTSKSLRGPLMGEVTGVGYTATPLASSDSQGVLLQQDGLSQHVASNRHRQNAALARSGLELIPRKVLVAELLRRESVSDKSAMLSSGIHARRRGGAPETAQSPQRLEIASYPHAYDLSTSFHQTTAPSKAPTRDIASIKHDFEQFLRQRQIRGQPRTAPTKKRSSVKAVSTQYPRQSPQAGGQLNNRRRALLLTRSKPSSTASSQQGIAKLPRLVSAQQRGVPPMVRLPPNVIHHQLHQAPLPSLPRHALALPRQSVPSLWQPQTIPPHHVAQTFAGPSKDYMLNAQLLQHKQIQNLLAGNQVAPRQPMGANPHYRLQFP